MKNDPNNMTSEQLRKMQTPNSFPADIRNGQETSRMVVRAIKSLHNALEHEYGTDFAYVVVAKGHYLGASNKQLGLIVPVTAQNK